MIGPIAATRRPRQPARVAGRERATNARTVDELVNVTASIRRGPRSARARSAPPSGHRPVRRRDPSPGAQRREPAAARRGPRPRGQQHAVAGRDRSRSRPATPRPVLRPAPGRPRCRARRAPRRSRARWRRPGGRPGLRASTPAGAEALTNHATPFTLVKMTHENVSSASSAASSGPNAGGSMRIAGSATTSAPCGLEGAASAAWAAVRASRDRVGRSRPALRAHATWRRSWMIRGARARVEAASAAPRQQRLGDAPPAVADGAVPLTRGLVGRRGEPRAVRGGLVPVRA